MATSTVAHNGGGKGPDLPKTVERTHDLSCSTGVTLTARIILGLGGVAAGLLGGGMVGTSPVTRISRFVGGTLGSKVLAGAGGGTAFIALALLCCCTGRPSATVKKPEPQPDPIPEGLTCKVTDEKNQLVISSADSSQLYTLPIQDVADPFKPTLGRREDGTLSIDPGTYGLAIKGFQQPILLGKDVNEDGTLDVDSATLQHLVAFVRLHQETAARFSLDASEDRQQTLMDRKLNRGIAVWTDEATANGSGYVSVSHVEGKRVVQFKLGAILNLGGWTREGEESDTLSINVADKDELLQELPKLASNVRTRGFGFVNVTYKTSGELSRLALFRLRDDGPVYYQKREAGTTAFHYLDVTHPLTECKAAKADQQKPPQPAPEPRFTFVVTKAVTDPNESIRQGRMDPALELNQFTILSNEDNTQTVFVIRMDAVPEGVKDPIRGQIRWPSLFSMPIKHTGYTPHDLEQGNFSHLYLNRNANVVFYGSQQLFTLDSEKELNDPDAVGQINDEVATSLGKTLFAREMSERSQGDGMPSSLLIATEYKSLEDAVEAMKTKNPVFAANGLWAVVKIEGSGLTLIAAPPMPSEGEELDPNLRVIHLSTSSRFSVRESQQGMTTCTLDGQTVLRVDDATGAVSNGAFLAVVLDVTDNPKLHEEFGVSMFELEASQEGVDGGFHTPGAGSPVPGNDGPGLFPNIPEDAAPATEVGERSGQQAASQPGTPTREAPKQGPQPATPGPQQATAHAATPHPSAGNSGKAIAVNEDEGHVVVTSKDGTKVTIPIKGEQTPGAFYNNAGVYMYVETAGSNVRSANKPKNAVPIVKDFQAHQAAKAKAMGLAKSTAGTL